jgi:hypothetical protein
VAAGCFDRPRLPKLRQIGFCPTRLLGDGHSNAVIAACLIELDPLRIGLGRDQPMALKSLTLQPDKQGGAEEALVEYGQRAIGDAGEEIGGVSHLIDVISAEDGVPHQVSGKGGRYGRCRD